jgi:CRISPR-associated RAMP protein (TIGR02581 family)
MTAIPQPFTFEKLRVRYRLRAELVAVSGLRVGAGKSFDAAATDQPVIRDALGRPYIPGSSLKGALRSGLESILRGLGHKDLQACELFEKGRRCVGDPDDDDKGRGGRRRESITLADVVKGCCTACSLFGSPLLAGRVFVHDLPLLSGSSTELRDGVGIHRDLGTAQPSIKYDVEVVPTGTRFQLEMVLENVDPDRLALLLQTVELLHQGEILLGGLTTRGLGKVTLEKRSLEQTDAKLLLAGKGFKELDYPDQLKKAGERLERLLFGEATSAPG